MTLNDFKALAAELRSSYDAANETAGRRRWGALEYCQGLACDVGDLTKLLMIQSHLRTGTPDLSRIEHELSDCLWSILTIAEAVDVDLERAFLQTMREVKSKIDTQMGDSSCQK